MFAESLLESNAHGSGHRRQLATALSITMQTLALAALVAVSAFRPVEFFFATRNLPAPLLLPRVTPIVPEQVAQTGSSTEFPGTRPIYVVPSTRAITFPDPRELISDSLPVPASQLGLPSNGGASLRSALGTARGPVAKGPNRPVVVSRLSPGQLISRTEPKYPPIAKQAGIQGEVVLTAIISKTGKIESLQLKSGHPLLAQAALDAVRRWQYRPYILNGEAVEVETQVTVNFRLGR